MKIAVRDLLPNPFRHLERYPINQEKVDALVRSIKDTSFWDNLLARRAETDGKYEISYGHHRLIALKKAGVDEVDIPVRKLDDTAMAKIMANENMEEWGSSALIEQETIRAIVEGFAEGRIELPKVTASAKGPFRHAPSFVPDGGRIESQRGESIYTAGTLHKFLGWGESKMEAILNALAVIEKGYANEADFVGLTTRQAEAVAIQARRVERETKNPTLARSITKKLANGMRSATGHPGIGSPPKGFRQEVTVHTARRRANEMMGSAHKAAQPKKVPPLEKFVEHLVAVLGDLPSDRTKEKLDAVVKFQDHMHGQDRKSLLSALRGAAKRFTAYADKLES